MPKLTWELLGKSGRTSIYGDVEDKSLVLEGIKWYDVACNLHDGTLVVPRTCAPIYTIHNNDLHAYRYGYNLWQQWLKTGTMPIPPKPQNSVGDVLRADAALYDKKKADYAPNANPWENFDFSADFTAKVCRELPDNDRRRSTCMIIGTKISRLMTLGLKGSAKNESIVDTLADLRVYLAILECQQKEAK